MYDLSTSKDRVVTPVALVAVRSDMVILLLFVHRLMSLSISVGFCVLGSGFMIQVFVSFLVLQSSCRGRESYFSLIGSSLICDCGIFLVILFFF